MISTRAALLALASTVTLSLAGAAPTYTCLPDAPGSAHNLYQYVIRLVTGTDTGIVATRNQYQLPAVAASKVSVVTTGSLCRQAGSAYHAYVAQPGTPEVSRTLVV